MSPMRSDVRRVLTCLVAVGLILAAGCEADEAAPVRSGCAGLVADAAAAVETEEQVELLDAALTACPSYDAFAAQLAAAPGLIGYDVPTFVALRCDSLTSPARERTAACDPFPPPPTTVEVRTTEPELVFVGVTLDGRRIEIRPSDDVEFVGERPLAVKLNGDIATEAGCEGVLEQRAMWTAQAGDSTLTGEERDIASAFARHAWVVAASTGCEVDEPPTPNDGAGR